FSATLRTATALVVPTPGFELTLGDRHLEQSEIQSACVCAPASNTTIRSKEPAWRKYRNNFIEVAPRVKLCRQQNWGKKLLGNAGAHQRSPIQGFVFV